MAEYYERLRPHQHAAEIRMLDLVNRYHDTDVAGEALLQLGELYQQTERIPIKAVLAFTAVTYHHPDHEAARAPTQTSSELLGRAGARAAIRSRVLQAPRPAAPATIAVAQTARPVQDPQRPQRRPGATRQAAGFRTARRRRSVRRAAARVRTAVATDGPILASDGQRLRDVS